MNVWPIRQLENLNECSWELVIRVKCLRVASCDSTANSHLELARKIRKQNSYGEHKQGKPTTGFDWHRQGWKSKFRMQEMLKLASGNAPAFRLWTSEIRAIKTEPRLGRSNRNLDSGNQNTQTRAIKQATQRTPRARCWVSKVRKGTYLDQFIGRRLPKANQNTRLVTAYAVGFSLDRLFRIEFIPKYEFTDYVHGVARARAMRQREPGLGAELRHWCCLRTAVNSIRM